EEGQQRLEREAVQLLGRGLKTCVSPGERISQLQRSVVDDLRGSEVDCGGTAVREEHRGQVAGPGRDLELRRGQRRYGRAIRVCDDVDERAVRGKGRHDALEDVGGRGKRRQRAQRRRAPGEVRFNGVTFVREALQARLVFIRGRLTRAIQRKLGQ